LTQVTLEFVDFYALLCIPRDAPPLDIKQAYHRILLATHPDKQRREDASSPLDIGLLQQAYTTLINHTSRQAYDASLAAHEARLTSCPRPAQVVSLEEFSLAINVVTNAAVDVVEIERWTYSCRCGGMYYIDTQQLEDDQHLIGCDSCSEVIWVGYEVEYEDTNG
jgi:diphthamide biosynthesis protein 4